MTNINKTAARLVHASAANLRTRAYYCSKSHSYQGRFVKNLLPTPLTVLHRLGFYSGKSNAKGYWKLPCPFHKDGKERSPSLNLHKNSGHYRCHACGAKGGDILSFYMNVTGKTFIKAAKELGAWEKNI
jgi:hypothetical protein